MIGSAGMRAEIKEMLHLTGQSEYFFNPRFEARCHAIFELCDLDKNGVLEGSEVREAVLEVPGFASRSNKPNRILQTVQTFEV